MDATKQLADSFKSARIPFDSLTLTAVISELRAHLLGGQVQDIRQPGPTDILLGIRNHNRNYLLSLAIDARFARVHLTSTRRPNLPTPPNFCMTLRKHLEDRRIADVRQPGFDRIVEFQVGARDAEPEMPVVTLIAELMGKHSNLVLVNEAGTILDAAKRISKRINRVRETLPGLTYQPPPEQPDRSDPFLPGAVEQIIRELPQIDVTDAGALARVLGQIYAGMSPFLAQELAARALADAQGSAERGLRAAWIAVFGAVGGGRFAAVVARDESRRLLGAYPVALLHLPHITQTPVAELNAGLDEAYREIIDRARYEAIQGELRGKIEREIKRAERQRAAASRALEEAGRAEEYKQTGDLLLANLWQIRSGDAAVTVQDYYAPDYGERVIALNPKLTPQENVEGYFHRYRKARDGQEKERERGAQLDAHLAELRRASAELTRLGTAEAVQSLREELLRKRLFKEGDAGEEKDARHESEFQGHKIRRFPTTEGFEILVGESATANDFLTTRLATPNDLWLHVRAAVSAHVVIRTHGKPDSVPRSVLERAAILCAQHSTQKHSSLVSVDYTLKKYVRKPRGASPGAADYQQEITIDVTP